MTKDSTAPPPGWEWSGDWEVNVIQGLCDKDGWMYAKNWSGKYSANKSVGSFVRRRCWTRRITMTADDDDPSTRQQNYPDWFRTLRWSLDVATGSITSTIDIAVDATGNANALPQLQRKIYSNMGLRTRSRTPEEEQQAGSQALKEAIMGMKLGRHPIRLGVGGIGLCCLGQECSDACLIPGALCHVVQQPSEKDAKVCLLSPLLTLIHPFKQRSKSYSSTLAV